MFFFQRESSVLIFFTITPIVRDWIGRDFTLMKTAFRLRQRHYTWEISRSRKQIIIVMIMTMKYSDERQ